MNPQLPVSEEAVLADAPTPTGAGDVFTSTKTAGPIKRIVTALWRQPKFKIAFGLLVVVVACAVFAPLVAPHDPLEQDLANGLANPSWQHLLGTDQLGRDVLSRLIFGARLSLGAAAIAVAVAGVLGIIPGLLAGFIGRWADAVIMRSTDALMSFPPLILALAITGVLGPGLRNAMIAVGVIFAPRFVRLTRSAVLDIRRAEFVLAARSMGVSESSILVRHVLPNSLGPILVQVTVTAGFAMLAEASLSYLGLGVQPPDASWGSMIGEAARLINRSKLLVIWPGAIITATVLMLSIIGDALRQALGLEGGGDRG